MSLIIFRVLAIVFGVIITGIVLVDTFETIVLPRTVTRELRLTRFFYVWMRNVIFRAARVRRGSKRELLLSSFGPLSLLLLFALWAILLVVSFAFIYWGAKQRYSDGETSLLSMLYLSGVTFFTLGYGDMAPVTPIGRALAVLEAGLGFGFLAVVIGYVPVMYQAFSRREVGISLLDARAGSPPNAASLLVRHGEAGQMKELCQLLREWERWASELLESHLSYPVLMFYRSQHDRQSWLAALTTILDTCAIIKLDFEDDPPWENDLHWQAQMTYAMARHAVVDLALVLSIRPEPPKQDRLPPEDFDFLCAELRTAGIGLCTVQDAPNALGNFRSQYESYVNGIAQRLFLDLPPWVVRRETAANWERSYWETLRHLE